MFPIKIAQYCDKLSKVVGVTLFKTDYPILHYPSFWANLPTPHPFSKRSEMVILRVNFQ